MQSTMRDDDTPDPFVAEGLVEPGTVERREGAGYRVRIRGTSRSTWAEACVGTALQSGDRVLLGEARDGARYVLGVLAAQDRTDTADRVATTSGATAAIVERDGEQRIEVRDAGQRLVFEYDPTAGKGSLTMPDGDLELRAPHGNIDLIAGRGIRCSSQDTLSLESERRVRMATHDPEAPQKPGASLSLDRGQACLAAEQVRIDAGQGEFSIGEATYDGSRLAVTVERVRAVMDRLETVAVRVIERAHDAYRYVRNLDLLKSGRSRRLIDGSYHVHSERAVIKADKDVKVRGDKIYLG